MPPVPEELAPGPVGEPGGLVSSLPPQSQPDAASDPTSNSAACRVKRKELLVSGILMDPPINGPSSYALGARAVATQPSCDSRVGAPTTWRRPMTKTKLAGAVTVLGILFLGVVGCGTADDGGGSGGAAASSGPTGTGGDGGGTGGAAPATPTCEAY